ncbi:hypothetical protein [Domibacillus indicus]|nr:hypothetical protein [Domibacillus indicus]
MNRQQEEGSILKGLQWSIGLSIPLWISFFGWLKLFSVFIKRALS